MIWILILESADITPDYQADPGEGDVDVAYPLLVLQGCALDSEGSVR